MKNGVVECHVCGSAVDSSLTRRSVSKAYDKSYDRRRSDLSSKMRFLNIILVVSDCCLLGLQPILVYMSKVDGKFIFSPISVNFLTETAKVVFTIFMLFIQARNQKPGEKSVLSLASIIQAARANYLLAVPAFLYAINNYLKFIMQLYFNPATTKMLSNLKVLMIALLLKFIMKRRFTVMQWEALGLLLIGISVNQLRATPTGATFGFPEATVAYVYTLFFITVPSLASVFNEYALKSQFDTSIYHQNLFLYGYGAIFNFIAIVVTTAFQGGNHLNIFHGHSKATMLLIINNAAQGILSSFFFKYADTILKKYSSTVATIFTGLASAALFGHTLTINFVLGVSIVFISMHQFFSSMSKSKAVESHRDSYNEEDGQMKTMSKESSLLNMAAGATEEAAHKISNRSEREPLLPIHTARESR